MKFIGKFVALTVALATALIALPSAAYAANTTPNTFSPIGSSWVTVPVGDRVYLQQFWRTDIDQNSLFYVPAGVTCTYAFDNTSTSATATGPMLMAEDGTYGSCVNADSSAYNPIDNNTRLGATPFGFSINFFGQNYSSAWPNTNGGITFGTPEAMLFNKSLPRIINSSESTAMFPLGADLAYVAGVSNMWTAQTTVDGLPAVVFSWEKFKVKSNNTLGGEISFQLVLLNVGGGDFNAYINFDKVSDLGVENGYESPSFLFDAKNDVTVGSNIVHSNDALSVGASCSTVAQVNRLGNVTSSISGNVYFKQQSAAQKTVSLWTDPSCTTPKNVTALQDEASDGKAYFELHPDVTSSFSAAIGWGTYNSSTKVIDWTEIQRNVLSSTLIDSGSNPLISQSLNTTVVGRYVIGQRNGQTVTDSATVGTGSNNSSQNTPNVVSAPSASPASLAETGFNTAGGIFIAASVIFLGVILLRRVRKKNIS